jgi:PTH1 family peptidyl-tRNA hydrolase
MSLAFVGLGNHMLKSTRHNLGSMSLDYTVEKLNLQWTLDKALGGWIAQTEIDTLTGPSPQKLTLIFFKPKTLMNISGGPVSKLLKLKNIQRNSLVLLHDDLERPVGKVSVKANGSPNGHNGIKSVAEKLKSLDIKRIRVGIDRPVDRDNVANYVLGKFTEAEMEKLNSDVYPLVHKTIIQLAKNHVASQ